MVSRLAAHNRSALLVLAALVAGGALFTGVLAQEAPEPVVPDLPCAPLAAYAADITAVQTRPGLGRGRATRDEFVAAQEALQACIDAHGLSVGQ
jgi:hypothetical protein